MRKYCWLWLLVIGLLSLPRLVQAQENVLVVYYSRTGNTRMVAKQLAQRFDADILELVDQKDRTGPLGFMAAGKDAMAKNLTELKPVDVDIDQYEVLLIGTPSWFGNITPAVRTFVSQNDLSEKTVGIFATTNKTGVEKALQQLADLITDDALQDLPRLPLRTTDLKDPEVLQKKIDAFYEKL